MIKSIILENWKTHQNSKIDFNNGTNILVGKMGSGKSSVVDAICYAFYGEYPASTNRRIKLDESVTFKPIKKDFAKVTLFFEYNNKNYKIERSIFIGKTNQAKLFEDDKLIAGPQQSKVSEKVSEILGINYKLFTKIIYSEQNEIDYFLKIPPGSRKEEFDNIFGIKDLDSIKENCRSVSREIDKKKETYKALKSQINEQLSAYDIQNLNKQKLEKTNLLTSKDKELEALNLEKDKLEIKKNKIIQIKKEFDLLNKNLHLFNFSLKQNEDKIQSFSNLDLKLLSKFNNDKEKIVDYKNTINEQLIKTKDVVKNLRNEVDSINNKSSFFKDKFEEIKKLIELETNKIKKIDLNEDSLKNKLEEVTLKIKEERSKLFEKNNLVKDLKKAILELNKGFAKCPICDSSLSKDQIIKKLEEKKEVLKDTNFLITQINKNILDLESKLKDLEKIKIELQNNKNIKEKLDSYNDQKEKLETNIQKLSVDFESKTKSLKIESDKLLILEEDFNLVNKNIDYLDLVSKKKELVLKINSTTNKIKDLNFKEEDYLKINSDYSNLDTKKKSIISEKKEIQENLDNINKSITNYKNLEQKLVIQKKNIDYLTKVHSNFVSMHKALEKTQVHLRIDLVNNINDALEYMWSKIYPYQDYTNCRLNSDKDYTLEVKSIEGEWYKVEGILSGGERTCAALAIRISIALILTEKLGLLILDEPTHNLDEKTISIISNLLEKKLPDVVDQIFVVTHDLKLSETVNASLYKIDRDKENDAYSVIS